MRFVAAIGQGRVAQDVRTNANLTEAGRHHAGAEVTGPSISVSREKLFHPMVLLRQ